MNELIKIERQEVAGANIQTVNARDLHSFLEVGKDFSNWIKDRIKKYGFQDGVDFTTISRSPELASGNRGAAVDYYISIDMAKELSMVERNAKGKEARQYFIECERIALSPKQQVIIPTHAEALRLAADMVEKNEALQKQIEVDRPKTIFADAVSASNTSILVGELAKLLKQNGIEIGQNRLFDWLRDNGYLIKRIGADRNMPTQRSMELGVLEIKERTVNDPNGSIRITRTPKITGKGQLYFVNKFIEENDSKKAA